MYVCVYSFAGFAAQQQTENLLWNFRIYMQSCALQRNLDAFWITNTRSRALEMFEMICILLIYLVVN